MANIASDKDTWHALTQICVLMKRSCCNLPRTVECTGKPVAWTRLCSCSDDRDSVALFKHART
jgi:hypothetical protein